jgi:hypothetical protein
VADQAAHQDELACNPADRLDRLHGDRLRVVQQRHVRDEAGRDLELPPLPHERLAERSPQRSQGREIRTAAQDIRTPVVTTVETRGLVEDDFEWLGLYAFSRNGCAIDGVLREACVLA